MNIPTEPSKFAAILADPPWAFRVWSKDTGQGRSAEAHYPTMSLANICNLSVSTLAAKDCALFMWATMPTLPEALQVITAWGFKYKTVAFTWAKLNKKAVGRYTEPRLDANWFCGMGYWTRANTELCLLATRGHPKRISKKVRQLLIAPIREHSQKPDEQYERIEQLVHGPYLELFARQRREGWAAWGNEIVLDDDQLNRFASLQSGSGVVGSA